MKRIVAVAILMFAAMASATVSNVPFTITYTCSGGYGPFAFTFSVSSATSLTVTLNGTVLAPGNYTVVPINNNYDNGGRVTLGSLYPCTAGWPLVLTRQTPITQTLMFYPGMPTPTVQFENGLDKLTEIAQEISSHSTLPDPTGHSGQYLGSNGGPLYVLSVPPGGGNVVGPGSSFANDIPAFTDTSGTLLKDVGIAYTNIPTMASAAAGSDNLLTTAGANKAIKDSGVPLASFGLPSQTSNAGKVLTTNGSVSSWAAGLPVFTPLQLGVTCNGTDQGTAWAAALSTLSGLGGGVIQLTSGNCNTGTTVWHLPGNTVLRGTGLQYTGLFSLNTPASYITVGCTDSFGCIYATADSHSAIENVAFVNTTTDTPFIFQTKMTLNVFASFTGKAGAKNTAVATNDAIVLGQQQNGTITCLTDDACYFTGYQSTYHIYTNKIRRAAVFNTCAQETTWEIHASATDSNSSADIDGTGRGPYVDLIGDTGGSACKAIQNRITVTGELGNPSPTGIDGDLHFNSVVRYDYAQNNQANVVADDSPASPHNSTAAIVATVHAQNNTSTCLQYQTSRIPCFSDANSGSVSNTYYDVPANSVYTQTLVAPNLGINATPVNTVKYGLYTVGTLPAAPHAPQTAWVSDGASATDCVTGLGSTVVFCKYVGGAWSAFVSGTGAVTTTGSPANGNLTKFSGATTVTNGDLSGDATTSGTLAVTVVKVNGASIPTSAVGLASNGSNQLVAATNPIAVPTVVDTSTPVTVSTTNNAEYHFNENATAGTAVTYNLPTAAAGKQFCFSNAYNGSAANTGVLTVATSASGQFIIFTDGTLSATGGNVTSAGAAADAACMVGVDSTHWILYVNRGTWTKH